MKYKPTICRTGKNPDYRILVRFGLSTFTGSIRVLYILAYQFWFGSFQNVGSSSVRVRFYAHLYKILSISVFNSLGCSGSCRNVM